MKLPARDTPIDYLLVLRGCAALGVFMGHVASIGSLSLGAVVSKGPWNYVSHAEPFEGWRTVVEILTPLLGLNFVVLFFVQSGYLMGKVFFDRRYNAGEAKAEFYWARYLRLAPLLYVNLIICALFFKYADTSRDRLIGDFLFINNFFPGAGVNSVTWSLSHEMQYYLVAPFVFLLGRRHVGWLLLAIVTAFLVGRYVDPFAYVYAFLVGFSVNLMPKPPIAPIAKHIGLIAGLLALHLGFNVLAFAHWDTAATVVATIISAGLVYLCEMPTERKTSALLRWTMLTGYLTYGFYLWHYVIIMTIAAPLTNWANALTSIPWLATIIFHTFELALALPLSYCFAWLSFVFVESRFRPGLYAGLSRPNSRSADR